MEKNLEPDNKHISEDITTVKHGGHKIRTGRKIIDRSRIGKEDTNLQCEKQPNQFTGHTFKNKVEKYKLDGHKLLYHLDRILEWQKGERIAPIQIDMGLTKFCNIGCIYCIGVTQGGMTKGMLIEPDALMRFIEDCGRLGVRSIAYIGDGEPTLNPGLYDSIILAKKLGIDIGMATNGILLDMNYAHQILRDSTFIRINLSAAEPESFKRIHQAPVDKFSILIEKVKNLKTIKNYHVKVKWNKINIFGETDLYKGGFRKYDICHGSPFLGQISGNGKVYPCGPFFGKERFFVGDIHKESYFDIVKSDRYWNVQQDIINNVDVHYDCTVGCRQDYINKFLWDIHNSPDHINFI